MSAPTKQSSTASGWRRDALAAALAGLAFAVWQFAAGWPTEGHGLVSLGLDAERSQLAVGLSAALLAGAVAALARGAWPAWPLGAGWFCALYLAPAVLHGLPAPARGEILDISGAAAAAVAQVGLALALSGIGAAAGRGLRSSVAALTAAAGHLDRRGLPVASGLAALTALSLFGLWAAPGIFLYGPWQGSFRASAGPATRQVTVRFHSAMLGADEEAVVILPSGYSTSQASRYPVLYLLHGSPGSDHDWPCQGAGEIVAAAAQQGEVPPMVVVAPNGDGPRGGSHDSWADGYVPGDQMETSLIDELIPLVEARFRVVADQAHRVIGGLSSGGYGAVNIALRHPGMFAAALDFSGDVRLPASAFGGDEAQRLANDPLVLASHPKPPSASAFFVGWGDSDPYAGENQQLAGQLRASGYLVVTGVATGGHQWSAWRSLLSDSVDQLGYLVGPVEG